MQENLTEEERIAKQRELIEAYGRIASRMGSSSLQGRVLGLLTFSDKEEFTFDEIVEELKISKSSISNTLNNLMDTDKIEYVTYAGDRKRYFRIKINSRSQFYKMLMEHFKKLDKIHRMAIDLKKDKNSRTAKQLLEIIEGLEFWKTQFKNYEAEFLSDDI